MFSIVFAFLNCFFLCFTQNFFYTFSYDYTLCIIFLHAADRQLLLSSILCFHGIFLFCFKKVKLVPYLIQVTGLKLLPISTGCGIKKSPKKSYISRKWRNLNYSNLQILFPRNIPVSISSKSIKIDQETLEL